MNRRLIIILAAVLGLGLIGAGAVYYIYYQPHRTAADEAAAARLTATELRAAFAQNEAQANQKYLNKTVAVRGEVVQVAETDTSLSVFLASDDPMFGVRVNYVSGNVPEPAPEKGDTLAAKGIVSGFLDDVVLDKAVPIDSF